MPLNNIVHVVVGIIKNQHDQIFIAKRAEKVHQGGLWEFPGGKVENNETVLDALKRELQEEAGITVTQATPLIRIHHDYTEKSVLLDVWRVNKYIGESFGNEGQETCWVNENDLSLYDFPEANIPILKSIRLPEKYMITGEFNTEEEFLNKIQSAVKNGIELIQFRAHELDDKVYFSFAQKAYAICENMGAQILLNTSFANYKKYKANTFSHGVHLNSYELKLFSPDKIEPDMFFSASVHNTEELLLANQYGLDFVVLSPVHKTLSHPDSYPLGWDKFYQLTENSKIPVYALGGMREKDLKIAINKGAQGIAAISEFWVV